MQNKNKPLLLRTPDKNYLWGGSRLNDEFEKDIDVAPLAEIWECSTPPDGPGYVADGEFVRQELAEVLELHPKYLGERHKGKNSLSILMKFIDAKKDGFVQIHPTDTYTREDENGQLGKIEMWYVPDIGLDAIRAGTVIEYLQKVPIHKENLFFLFRLERSMLSAQKHLL